MRATSGMPVAEKHPSGAAPVPELPQYSRPQVLAIWAAAALPMAVLAWIVAPSIAGESASPRRFFVTLLSALTLGLLWQAVLVLILVARERRDASWTTVRDRLWLRAPRSATRSGGRLWWWVLVFALALGAVDMAPVGPTGPDNRNFGMFVNSEAGRATFHHAWALYALVAVELVLNTVLGEELLFRGLLLPRMRGAFGRADWVVNSLLFGVYHLHEPWVIPNAIVTGFLCAGPTRRYRSALMGIAIHSVESAFFLVLLFPLVLG